MPKWDDVAAVAARVAAREQDGGAEQVLLRLRADDARTAQELRSDGGDHSRAQAEADERVDRRRRIVVLPGTNAEAHQHKCRHQDRDARQNEVAANAAQ